MISVYEPYISPKVKANLIDVYNSKWFSCGNYNDKVIKRLKEKFGFKYVILTNNGTNAVHLCASVIKYFGSDCPDIDVPDNVYSAAISPFVREGYTLFNHAPDLGTWCSNLSGNHDIGLVVHNLNGIVDVRKIREKYSYIIEDCCEALGGSYGNQSVGTLADCSAFSFYANKNITSGEGGLFVTKHKKFYDYAKLLWGQGLSDVKFIHSVAGYNYRMTNIQAAILDAQLDDFDTILQKKQKLFSRYYDAFADDRFIVQKQSLNTTPSNWMFGVGIKGKSAQSIINKLRVNGIDSRPMFCPLNRHGYTELLDESLESLYLWKSIVVIPSYPGLKPQEIDHIIQTLKS
jgi:perosamine synthetase